LAPNAKGVGAIYTCEDGSFVNHWEDLPRHFHYDFIGIAVSQQSRKGAPPCHAIAARIVDHDQVEAAGLLTLCRQAVSCATADDGLALARHALKFRSQLLSREAWHQCSSKLTGHQFAIFKNSSTAAWANCGSFMWEGKRIAFRRFVWRRFAVSASNSAASAAGSQNARPGASSAETPPRGNRNLTSPSHWFSFSAIHRA